MPARESLALVHRQAPLDAEDDAPSTGTITPPPPEPWPLIERARTLIARYLAEPPAAIDTIIFWCLHTWAHARFDVSPRLILHGRDPRADHARALRLLRWLTPNPRLVSRATASTVLDLLAHERATLLFDDAANAILLRRDMRALIAAGARQDGMFLGQRGRRKEQAFRRCAAPLAIATSLAPPESVLAHAIVLPMAPALVHDGPSGPRPASRPGDARALRADFQAFAQRLAAARTRAYRTAAAVPLGGGARNLGAAVRARARDRRRGGGRGSRRRKPVRLAPIIWCRKPRRCALLRDIRRVAGIDGQAVPSKFLADAADRRSGRSLGRVRLGQQADPARYRATPGALRPANRK